LRSRQRKARVIARSIRLPALILRFGPNLPGRTGRQPMPYDEFWKIRIVVLPYRLLTDVCLFSATRALWHPARGDDQGRHARTHATDAVRRHFHYHQHCNPQWSAESMMAAVQIEPHSRWCLSPLYRNSTGMPSARAASGGALLERGSHLPILYMPTRRPGPGSL
jgi:hypothetical protein